MENNLPIPQQLNYPLDYVTQEILGQIVDERAVGVVANQTHGRQVFTSSGTFTVPSGVRYVDVIAIGCGAGGGVGIDTIGGGGGATVQKMIDLNGVASVSVTIGNVGAGADTYNDGSTTYYTNSTSGGSVSFGSYITANGGIAGDSSGSGGTASGGDINIDGQDGTKTITILNTSSSSDDYYVVGGGGNTFMGYGAVPVFITYNTAMHGNDGQAYGGGGGCGKGYNDGVNVHRYGGDGGTGVVIVTY